MAELIYGDPIDYGKLAKEFNLRVEFVANLIAKYAPSAAVGTSDRHPAGKLIKFQRR